MYVYGRKWQEALHRILMRLASDDGYGFLVIEGPDASGKTDLLTLVSDIAEDASAIQNLPEKELRDLGQLVHARRYLQIRLEDAEEGDSIPMSMIRSKAVLRVLGWLGAVAGVLLFTGTWLPRVDVSLYTVWIALSAPVLLWEIGLGLWLFIRGTKQAGDLTAPHSP